MKSILALAGTGSTLAIVGVGLLEAAAVVGLSNATGWPIWLWLAIVGGVSVAVGAAVIAATKPAVHTVVEENLTIAGQAKHLPWVTMGVAVLAGLALSRFVRWASHGAVVPTIDPPKPPDIVPIASCTPPSPAPAAEAPRRELRPRPLFGELGTALRGLGESALSSVLKLGARTLGEKLLAQVFEGGPHGTTAQAGHHDRHRNGSHPSPSF